MSSSVSKLQVPVTLCHRYMQKDVSAAKQQTECWELGSLRIPKGLQALEKVSARPYSEKYHRLRSFAGELALFSAC